MKTLENRFWSKVSGRGSDGCWEWVGCIDRRGYGQLGVKVGDRWKGAKAHRVSWELHRGVIPEMGHVCHDCDNPSCINPSHLFLGSHQDNMADRLKKDRFPKGENHARTKLTDQQVDEVRMMYSSGGKSYAFLGGLFGVSHSTIGKVVNGIRKKTHERPDMAACFTVSGIES